MTNPILALARPDILQLQPYQHAAWDPTLERMHANEMPWRATGDNTQAGLNRYPEPQPRTLVERMSQLYGAPAAQLLVGRGSDEA
ncbi:MAG: histidinol-phosphate transaminase, partial [Steroidobacteraceae bacterium]